MNSRGEKPGLIGRAKGLRAYGAGLSTLILLAGVAALAGAARGSTTVPHTASGTEAAPAVSSAPIVIGTARGGNGLAASKGMWNGSPSSFTYQWQRCSPGCAPIGGATGATYALVSDDVNSTVKVTVTATNGDGSASADSAATAILAAAAAGSPLDSAAPVLSGSAKQGEALAASTGSWSGSGNSYTYQWLRCDSSGGGCSNIGSATGITYNVSSADAGSTVRVTVSATNGSGSNSAVSAQSGVVSAGKAPSNTKKPTISGTPRDNETVKADPGKWDGETPISFSYQWQRCDSNGGNCSALKNKTKQKYEVRSSDEGHTLRVLITATNSAGSSAALSDPVAVASRSKPRNTSRPTISGNPVLGQVLTASRGEWNGTSPIGYTYSWQRCNAGGGNCSTIGGARASTFKLTTADVGHRLRAKVVARNSVGTEDTTSALTPVIQATAPANTSRPVIGGTARQGSTLAATAGGWSSAAALVFYYQWARCDANGRNCAPIPGATRPTYVLAAADVGHRLIVQVKAQNNRGAGFANSLPTAVVAAPAPTVSPTSAPISSVFLPNRLIIDQIQFSPRRIHSRSEPLIARFHVRETTGNKSVSGAYVYAVGVPFDRLSGTSEVKTDANGWATITFRVLPTFTLRPGNLVVIFVRARKPGGNPLAGISTRRLVSVRVG